MVDSGGKNFRLKAEVRPDRHEIKGCGNFFIKRELSMTPPGR